MDFQEYQEKALKTALYPNQGHNFVYPVLGLTGEAGEVAEKIKKVFRDHGGQMKETQRLEIKKELGDVLWYIASLATELKLNLQEIAEENIAKLYSRKDRGTLHGDGDNR